MENKLFRQQAMDALEAPDRINDYIRVTAPSFYLWLTGLLVCVVAVCIWAFGSTINDFVKIQGIVFPHESVEQVAAPLGGRITEVFVQKGDCVQPGDLLFRYTTEEGGVRELRTSRAGVVLSHKVEQETFNVMEPCVYLLPTDRIDHRKEIVAFVTYADLRKLRVGMEVQATPSDLKREEVGYMYGRITAIGDLPTSAKEATTLFKLEEFTNAVYPDEAAFLIKIELENEPADKERIRWSNSRSGQVDIKIGTFCNLQIVTRSRPVYELLFNR